MRIGGWILLVLGIVFELLFVMARLGGAQMPVTAYIVGGFLILMGWRLKTFGKGIAPAAPSASAAAAAQQNYSAPQSPTVELPLTPTVAEIIRASMAKSRKLFIIMTVVGVVVLLGIGIAIDASMPNASAVLPIMASMALFLALMFGGIWILQMGRPAWRDLRETTYLRTSGPIQVVSIMTGNMLRLTDRAFLVDGRQSVSAILAKMNWATVDYSRHAHVILGVWNQAGANVYTAPGYLPGA